MKELYKVISLWVFMALWAEQVRANTMKNSDSAYSEIMCCCNCFQSLLRYVRFVLCLQMIILFVSEVSYVSYIAAI